jgi:hypothetical protein
MSCPLVLVFLRNSLCYDVVVFCMEVALIIKDLFTVSFLEEEDHGKNVQGFCK